MRPPARTRTTTAHCGRLERRQKEAIIGASIKTILECLGEDPNREGLLQTPKRYARAMLFFTQGYAIDARGVVNDAIFTVDTRELVLIRDIELFSLCEHHLVPFHGKVTVSPPPPGTLFCGRFESDCAGAMQDPYRLRARWTSPGAVEARPDCRGLLAPAPGPRAIDAGDCRCHQPRPGSDGGGGSDRIDAPVHVHARRSEIGGHHHHLVYDRCPGA